MTQAQYLAHTHIEQFDEMLKILIQWNGSVDRIYMYLWSCFIVFEDGTPQWEDYINCRLQNTNMG